MCDIKIKVKTFKAYPRSRYGGNETFVIWDKNKKVSPPTEPVAIATGAEQSELELN
jgi:hypothetical protein